MSDDLPHNLNRPLEPVAALLRGHLVFGIGDLHSPAIAPQD